MTSEYMDYTGLIPEYLNDLLDEKSRAAFEAALKVDPLLTEELEEFRELNELYRSAIPETEQPSEPVFEKILSRIEAQEGSAAEGYREINYKPSASIRLSEIFNRFKNSISIPWTLALVQAAVIVLLVVNKPPENTFNTLGTTPQASTETQQIILNIVFDDAAREADIRDLLLQINGTIIDGPSLQGRYQVRVAKAEMDDQTFSELQRSELISFAEQSQ